MKKGIIIITVIIFILLVLIIQQPGRLPAKLISPGFNQIFGPKTTPTPSPNFINAPKTFKFDSSTDLKKELENINPQVLDSDFE